MPESIPRPEYPRPQMVRKDWMNLNGLWEFEMDLGDSGRDRGLPSKGKLEGTILVPFCPESELSGAGYTDFMRAVWYRREFLLPEGWFGRSILLHFGAVDYEAEIWVNGRQVGLHQGGYSSFTFEISDLVQSGANTLTVCARDNMLSGLQPAGKQSRKYHSYECSYTRTTGIWQTVWLEAVPTSRIERIKYYPDPENSCLYIQAFFSCSEKKLHFNVGATYHDKCVGNAECTVFGSETLLRLELSEKHLWAPGKPELYNLVLTLWDDSGEIDTVHSYFGLRSITIGKNAILINGEPIFQRLVLDQGFYPKGIYTAPTDIDLCADIQRAMLMGFNGARLHQKVFEQRFLYWADMLGYMVWGEYADTGLDITTARALESFAPEWMEVIARDFNSPSIVGWCPFNETRDNSNGCRQDDHVIRTGYTVTKAIDPTRPVIDASGFVHVQTDIFDIHDYEQDPKAFKEKFAFMCDDPGAYNTHPTRQKYSGQPYFISEFGGIWWSPGNESENQMSYGLRPRSEEEYLVRYEGLVKTLLDHPRICGFCYTQLYDVEQEVNGLYTYERRPKFETSAISRINSRPACIERNNCIQTNNTDDFI